MYVRVLSIVIALLGVSSVRALAQEAASLNNYTCAQFLLDVEKPEQGTNVLRSLMIVAWATGYAAAHQASAPRADTEALKIMASNLAQVCRKQPTAVAFQLIAGAIAQISDNSQFGNSDRRTSSIAPPVSAVPVLAGGFRTFENFDIPQGDLRRVERVELSKCAATCESDRECKAYSYDKWNRWCFLKSIVPALTLDPGAVSGVRKDIDVPQEDKSPIRIESVVSKALRGASYRSSSLESAQECQQSCEQDQKCLGFTFAESNRQCRLFDNIRTVERQQGVTSGYKTQSNP